MDALCWGYYREIGFYEPNASAIGTDGMIASHFHLYTLERLLADHCECVIDLGAGNSVHAEAANLLQMQKALGEYPNVFLVLPSPDLHTSAEHPFPSHIPRECLRRLAGIIDHVVQRMESVGMVDEE